MPGLNTRVTYVTASFTADERPSSDAIHQTLRDLISLRTGETIITVTITNRNTSGQIWTFTVRAVVGIRTGGPWRSGRSLRDDNSVPSL